MKTKFTLSQEAVTRIEETFNDVLTPDPSYLFGELAESSEALINLIITHDDPPYSTALAQAVQTILYNYRLIITALVGDPTAPTIPTTPPKE